MEEHKLDGVISMPSGVFKPYAGGGDGDRDVHEDGGGGDGCGVVSILVQDKRVESL